VILEEVDRNDDKNHRRSLGVHLTSKEIFKKYILPEIRGKLDKYLWVDLYAGEGNLILPILDEIPANERINFFENHIFLFDVQPEMVEKCRSNTVSYGIPLEIAKNNITIRDNLNSFPVFLKNKMLPIFHITNPPYLYLGYIRKHEETKIHLKHFEGKNKGYQDLYQIAMINDLRNNVENIIYIIPTNFIFGAAVSNKFRKDFLKYYNILKMYIFETKIFEFTGTNICISFFRMKKMPKTEEQEFKGLKFKNKDKKLERRYHLIPRYKYRGGSEFNKFVQENIAPSPLKVIYYIQRDEIQKNSGGLPVKVIDTSNYISNDYQRIELKVNNAYHKRITSNILYVRTVDTGTYEGRAGLGIIREDFDVEGVYVSGNTYRTSPIHIILEPEISKDDQILLKDYFNFILEFFRKKLDSEFLTTYKYSKAEYTRKYLGLTQVREIIETFPILSLNNEKKEKIKKMIINKDFDDIFTFLTDKKVNTTLKPNDITSWL